MALTPGGTPYIESSDLVANYPAVSLALANKIDTKANTSIFNTTAGWVSFNPNFGGNFTIGNGTQVGQFMQIGKLVVFYAVLTLGTTSSFAAGNLTYSPPVSLRANQDARADATALESGVGFHPLKIHGGFIFAIGTAATYAGYNGISATIPFTWKANDNLFLTGMGEAA